MNTEQETNIRMEENELNLGDILQTVLANWYWFVLSVVVCAGTAFLYLKWAPKVYTRTASVLIKDDAKGGAMSESAAFEDLGLFGSKRNVDNEVLVFKSRRLMTEVARTATVTGMATVIPTAMGMVTDNVKINRKDVFPTFSKEERGSHRFVEGDGRCAFTSAARCGRRCAERR